MKNAIYTFIALLIFSFTAIQMSAASRTVYTDRATFEAEFSAGTLITDDYSTSYPPGFGVFDNATMTAFFGETEYFSTGFLPGEINIIQPSGTYCAGCNGSFELRFANTSISEGGIGVQGVGVDVTRNISSLPYVAYVTYGDGTTENFPLPIFNTGNAFFGITSPQLIEKIHFGLADGETTTGGSFAIDNLTLGSVPLVVPTMSQWAFLLFGLSLFTTAVVGIYNVRMKLG